MLPVRISHQPKGIAKRGHQMDLRARIKRDFLKEVKQGICRELGKTGELEASDHRKQKDQMRP
jgi:hypothetical protein